MFPSSSQISNESSASSAQRREKLSELDSHVQTLSSQVGEYREVAQEVGSEAKKRVEQLSERNGKATEECSALMAQTQTAVEEGVGSLEKVFLSCTLCFALEYW